MKVALTGNPNSGKTTLFNGITGKIEHVGNWAGVTVDKKEGKIKKRFYRSEHEVIAVDLPGAYSISPFTSEEGITRSFIRNENPDIIINVVDGTNLSRSLFFTTQLLELGIPVVIALNKSDINLKKGTTIDTEKLAKELKCPVVETSSNKAINNGFKKLINAAISTKNNTQEQPFTNDVVSDNQRYDFVKELVLKIEAKSQVSTNQTIQDSIDRIVANRWLGIPIFALIMWSVFSLSQTSIGPFLADIFVGWIDSLYVFIEKLLGNNVSPVLSALLLDGMVGGVGAVIGFLPLIMVLFFLLTILEDSGYMARVAIVMDKFFKKVGLSGKAIIPMIIGTSCAIPGIMATRTIKNERQRRTTAMLTPFMPCGAKLPVIALFSGVFFNNAAWVGTSMYFLGILIIILGALIVVRITGDKRTKSYFIMELPEYKIPSIKIAFISTLAMGKSFIAKAGTIILLCNAIVHILQTFTPSFKVVLEGAENSSLLAAISTPFAILLLPLGFGVWQLAAAAITGFIAKENVVGTLAVVYSITNFIDTEELALISNGAGVAGIMGLTSVAALSYLTFNLFTPPCFAAIGAMNSEMNDKKWLWGGIGFQFAMGYVVSFLIYQIGTLITTGNVGMAFPQGLIVVLAIISFVYYLTLKGSKVFKEDTALSA